MVYVKAIERKIRYLMIAFCSFSSFSKSEIEAVVKYAKEMLRERTEEERLQGDRELTERLNAYMKRSKQPRIPVRYAPARPKRFFGIGLWF